VQVRLLQRLMRKKKKVTLDPKVSDVLVPVVPSFPLPPCSAAAVAVLVVVVAVKAVVVVAFAGVAFVVVDSAVSAFQSDVASVLSAPKPLTSLVQEK